ncbi:hypothetical protein NIES4072_49350 [Nostoc commune NIES-4072]|uniref:Uncharacterized protein n=1 Tax=Nostoc commune NIES-4072 TaxID=2005467 RepID=A0A2R5FZH9_NOSCO|nr:hypothetical protein NIES4070_41600 [Nostoc commune HK-02]GBG21251.1 hypothetical protein NIES4072_49350 [Nostoc commune NIES-4072]
MGSGEWGVGSGGMREQGEQGEQGRQGDLNQNLQQVFPLVPNSQESPSPLPNTPFPMPNAQIPIGMLAKVGE